MDGESKTKNKSVSDVGQSFKVPVGKSIVIRVFLFGYEYMTQTTDTMQ